MAAQGRLHDGFQHGLLHGDELVLVFGGSPAIFPLLLFVTATAFSGQPTLLT